MDVAVVTVAVAEASLPAEAAAEVAAAAVTVAVEVLAVAVVLLEAEEVPVAEPVEARAVEPRLSLSPIAMLVSSSPAARKICSLPRT